MDQKYLLSDAFMEWLEKNRPEVATLCKGRDIRTVLVYGGPPGPRFAVKFPGTGYSESSEFDVSVNHDMGMVVVDGDPETYFTFLDRVE